MVHLSNGMTLSVIRPVYNVGENFRRCLSTVATAIPPADEIIVIADGFILMLIGGLWWLGLFAVACGLILSLLILSALVYCFFLQKQGLWFMIQALPWHWFYYFDSGLAFAIGLGRSLLFGHRSSKPNLSAARKGLPGTVQSPECR